MKKRTTRFKVHVFICTRQRDDETKSCAEGEAPAVKERLKNLAEERGWKPQVRVSEAGCLGVCAAGPNVMIYPQKFGSRVYALVTVMKLLKRSKPYS